MLQEDEVGEHLLLNVLKEFDIYFLCYYISINIVKSATKS